jgi:uncharacterized protein (DUF1697 family)
VSLYVALLRGINVGGRNLIKMTDLKACFEERGFREVATYIQSGNVLFRATEAGGAKLTRRIETMLAATFDYQANVLIRSERQMQDIVRRAPKGFGAQPAKYRYDVIFLKEPLTPATALKSVRVKEGVDRAQAGSGVLYFTRLVSKASQSQLSRLASMPLYQGMTIRNWNTTTKLLGLMEAIEP